MMNRLSAKRILSTASVMVLNGDTTAYEDAIKLAIEALSHERPKGRWVRIPEELNCNKLFSILAELYCPRHTDLNDWQGTELCFKRDNCKQCWEEAMRGEEE